MTSQPKRRWLPRFGLRSLFALVLAVAAYFGSWPWVEERAKRDVELVATERLGDIEYMRDRASKLLDLSVEAPFVVSVDEGGGFGFGSPRPPLIYRRYYLWLGQPLRLPWTSPHKYDVSDLNRYPPLPDSAILRNPQAFP